MSEIKNGGLDQYGAEHFEQQQFRTSGVAGVNIPANVLKYRTGVGLVLQNSLNTSANFMWTASSRNVNMTEKAVPADY